MLPKLFWPTLRKKNRNFLGLENSILLPKLFWPTVRKNCSSDRKKPLKFEIEGREFAKLGKMGRRRLWMAPINANATN